MNKERELLIQAIDAYDVCCDENDAYYERLNNAFEEIRNYLICEPEDEPVAWVDVKETDQGPYEFHGIKLLPVGKHNLYTRPAQERKPMTKEEIAKGFLPEPTTGMKRFRAGVRFAERHHGIGGSMKNNERNMNSIFIGTQPLYETKPKPERKPMTMEDLETLARRCDYENDKVYVDEELCVDSFDYKNL